MYLSLITVLLALCGLSYGKEFVVTSSTFQGSGVYDHDMLNTACQSIGAEYVPARIDSATENADASAACIATGSGWCWFGVVRDDVSNTEWYHLADGASVNFTSWDQGQPGSAESCVALRGEPWHDWGCNLGPLRVLCMLQPTTEPSKAPSKSPTRFPSETPTRNPSESPTRFPSVSPTLQPTVPTLVPSESPFVTTDDSNDRSYSYDSDDDSESEESSTETQNIRNFAHQSDGNHMETNLMHVKKVEIDFDFYGLCIITVVCTFLTVTFWVYQYCVHRK